MRRVLEFDEDTDPAFSTARGGKPPGTTMYRPGMHRGYISTMALDWHRVVDGHTVDQLYEHFGLSERALVYCLDRGYQRVRQIRLALADTEMAAAMDSGIRHELHDLLAAHEPPPGEKQQPPYLPSKSKRPLRHSRQTKQGQWPGIPPEIWQQALHDPQTEVLFLIAHLSARCRHVLIRYLSPECRVADMDKLIFSDLHFGKFRNIGALSVLELDHWRMQMRHLRAAAQALAAEQEVRIAIVDPVSGGRL